MILIQLEWRAREGSAKGYYRDDNCVAIKKNDDRSRRRGETRRAPPTKSTDNDDGDDDGLASVYGSDSARPDAALEPRSD